MPACALHFVALIIVCGSAMMATLMVMATTPNSTTATTGSIATRMPCNSNNGIAINAAINENHFKQLATHSNNNAGNHNGNVNEKYITAAATTEINNTTVDDIALDYELNAALALATATATAPASAPATSTTAATSSNHKLTTSTSSSSTSLATPAASMKLLSRKRRYLIFPDGSSFQVVYDGIYGIVDYTNYLILGITVALAWELPTEMPSELFETVQGRLANGTLGLTRRKDANAANIKYSDVQQQQQQQQQQPQYIHAQTHAALPANTRYYTNTNGNTNYQYYKQRPAYFQVPMHKQYDFYYRQPSNNKHSYYYTNNERTSGNNIVARTYGHQQQHGFTPHNGIKFPWWRLNQDNRMWQRGKAHATLGQRRLDYSMPQPQQQQLQQQPNGYYQTNSNNVNGAATAASASTSQATTKISKAKALTKSSSKAKRKHRIYPVFGKRRRRSAAGRAEHRPHRHGMELATRHDDELDKLDRLHIRHHRWTRHTLYGKIEKYLDRRGSHGQHCVLRALCETAQRSTKDRRPGTFVGEIMRALFTLPEMLTHNDLAVERVEADATKRENRLLQHYDEAHGFEGDCAQRYKYCQDSLWTSQFIK